MKTEELGEKESPGSWSWPCKFYAQIPEWPEVMANLTCQANETAGAGNCEMRGQLQRK